MSCPTCDSTQCEIFRCDETFDIEGDEIMVDNLELTKCRECGQTYASVLQFNTLGVILEFNTTLDELHTGVLH